jgi:DDE family transposase
VQVTFDAGRLSSDGGLLALAEIERRLRIAERLARIEDPRAPDRVQHGLAKMIPLPGAPDRSRLRRRQRLRRAARRPVFKMAVGRLPESAADLCSHPTMCRLESLPGQSRSSA